MEPVFGDIDVIFEPTVSVNPFVLMSPYQLCLTTRLYQPLHDPPNINVKVFAVSFAAITLRILNIVLSELFTIIAVKSFFCKVYKKLFYKYNTIFCFNTGETELGTSEFPRVVKLFNNTDNEF